MFDIVQMLLDKPIRGIVTALVVATVFLYGALGSTEEAVAVLQDRSTEQREVNNLVREMNDRLIRVDQNLINLTKEKT